MTDQQRAQAIFDWYWGEYLIRKKQRDRMIKELTDIVGKSIKITGVKEYLKSMNYD